MRHPKKVFVAISGGIDSSVCALLLKREGYDVTGVYMKNWSGDSYGIQADCPWEEDQKSAEDVCKHLNIPFRSFNFEKAYRDAVVEYFFNEYKKGRTPNPDILCNKEIKFKLFREKSLEEGADLIATGHYVRQKTNSDNNYSLHKGLDEKKDQSYFLYTLDQEVLRTTLFPIGNYQKNQIREIGKEANLPNHTKPDSQGICFIGEINVREFLIQKLGKKVGHIIDIDDNKILSKHEGAHLFTLGQREGLRIGGSEAPYFVCELDTKSNTVFVCKGKKHPKLFQQEVHLESLHLINPNHNISTMTELSASARYRQKPQPISTLGQDTKFKFKEEQRAITPGQSLVLYNGSEILGGGIIKTAF